ncbi:MAG: class I SAM-dependent methyltransferase, partial [Candidatus Cloacimonetes bacterium]|nr:class I SAM-dependent methyltransferase [Candidatus Cloacimonadota bacterium]
MAIPIIDNWKEYFINPDEGLGSSYERIVLNNKLMEICEKYHIKKILEAPLFGFTGISGINSIALAKTKHHITLVDHDQERMELIRQTWIKLNINADFNYLEDYYQLPFPAKVFDFSWNFSALWFVRDLEKFLSELSRVTSQAILICVPNRSGLGYLTQKWGNGSSTLTRIYEENINPALFCNVLHLNGWKLEEQGYIDCPPWPDIGMPKEKFLRKIGMGWL